MNEDKLNDIIKQKADNHTAPVPPDAWDNITKKKKRRILPFYWWSLSALLIIAGAFLYFSNNKKKSNGLVSCNLQLQSNQLTSAKTNLITTAKNLSQGQMKDSVIAATKENIAINDTNKTDKQDAVIAADLKNQDVDNKAKERSTTTSSKAKMHMIVTDGVVVADNIDNNKASSKKYNTGKKIKFKTTSIGPASDSEPTIQTVSNAFDKNSTDLNNTTTYDRTSFTKEDAIVNNRNRVITTIQIKSPIDLSFDVLKKDIALNNKKDTAQKKTNTTKLVITPSLIFDLSVTPFWPVQQYDVPQYIRRTSTGNGGNTVYTTNSVKTSLQFSAAFAFGARKSISKKIMVGTGLQYEQISENVSLTGIDSNTTYMLIQRLQVSSSGSYLVNDSISSTTAGVRVITATNSYKLYSVPVFMQYSFLSHPSFSLAVTLGSYFTFAQYHNSISGKLESIYAYTPLPSNEKNNLAIDLFGGVRATETVCKNFMVFAEPNFRYNISGYKLKNTFLNKTINQSGITLGLSYKINQR